MDISSTQVYDDSEYSVPTQKILCPSEEDNVKQIGELIIDSVSYPINRGINTIGRHPECQIQLADQTVSKNHAEIEARDSKGSTWICDLNSANKTILNNIPLRSERYYELKDNGIIKFGRVTAKFKIIRSTNDFVIPETPTVSHQKKIPSIIPVTPDSSLSNSSTVEEEISIIPATQNQHKSFFLKDLPSISFRQLSTIGSKKRFLIDSSIDDIGENSHNSTEFDKSSIKKDQSKDIFNAKTQSFTAEKQLNYDNIYDMETQNVCLDDIKHFQESNSIHKKDISDLDRQRRASNICDIETQETEDNVFDRHTLQNKGEDACCMKNSSIKNSIEKAHKNDKAELNAFSLNNCKLSSNNSKQMDLPNQMENTDNKVGTSNEDETCKASSSKQTVQSDTALEDNISVHSKSPDLLENYKKELTAYEDNIQSISCISEKSSSSKLLDQNSKSHDEENTSQSEDRNERDNNDIYNALTPPIRCDDSDSDFENIVMYYIGKSAQKGSNNRDLHTRSTESDSSDTDKEGCFMEIVKKTKETSLSVDVSQDKSKEDKSDSIESQESDDIFEVPTQPPPAEPELKTDVAEAPRISLEDNKMVQIFSIGNMAPTQKTHDLVHNIQRSINSKDTKRGRRTAVLKTGNKSTKVPLTCNINYRKQKKSIPNKSDDTVQSIDVPKSDDVTVSSTKLPPICDLKQNICQDGSIKDLDYEKAATQLLEVVQGTSDKEDDVVLDHPNNVRISETIPEKQNVNLNDTLEQHLNDMFSDTEDQNIDEPSQISTQYLEDILQLTQNNVSHSPESKELRVILQKMGSNKTPKKSTTNIDKANSDSQSTDLYFASLVTKRKRNIIIDSQDVNISVNNIKARSSNKKNTAIETDKKNVGSTTDSVNATKVSNNNLSKKINSGYLQSSVLSKRKDSKVSDISDIDLERNIINSLKASTPLPTVKAKQRLKTQKESDESDDDILSRLPVVKISGTLSNTSSRSSSPVISKQISKSKKLVTSKKPEKITLPAKRSLRMVISRINDKDGIPFRVINNSQSVTSTKNSNDDVNATGLNPGEASNELSVEPNETAKRKVRHTRYLSKSNKSKTKIAKDNIKKKDKLKSSTNSRNDEDVADGVFIKNSMRSTRASAKCPVKRSLCSSVENNGVDNTKDEEDDKEFNSKLLSNKKVTSCSIVQLQRIPISLNQDNSVRTTRSKTNVEISNSEMLLPNSIKFDIANKSKNQSTKCPQSNLKNNKIIVNDAHGRTNKNTKNVKETSTEQRKDNSNQQKTNILLNPQIDSESQEVEMIMGSILNDGSRTNTTISVNLNKPDTNRRISTRKRKNVNLFGINNEIADNNTVSDTDDSDNTQYKIPNLRSKRANIESIVTDTSNIKSKIVLKISNLEAIDNSKNSKKRKNTNISIKNQTIENSVASNTYDSDNTQFEMPSLRSKRAKRTITENSSSDLDSSIKPSWDTSASRSSRSMSSSLLNLSSSSSSVKHKVLLTGISDNKYIEILKKLGASIVNDFSKCTILITDKVRRTFKFLCALSRSTPIVSIDWLIASEKAGHFLNWENYIVKDITTEKKFGFDLRESLEKAGRKKLLANYTIILTPNINVPPISELKSIIYSCGGKPLLRPPTQWPEKAVILSSNEDVENAHRLALKAPRTVTIQTTEFLLTGILKQELDFNKYKLT